MKAKKKYPIRRDGRRMKYGVVALTVLVLSILIVHAPLSSPSPPYHPNPNTFYFKAAIVDQESLTYPNPSFVQNATTTLENGGFTVDYIKAADTTVDFYSNLPTDDYGIIILRVHSAVAQGSGWVYLTTGENYSIHKYVLQQLEAQLVMENLTANGQCVFGLGSNFRMNGHFENTIIIMMGCNGLCVNGSNVYAALAQMFIRYGAKAYVGWTGSVTGSGSDNAVLQLLQYLLVKRETLVDAITSTPSDPVTNAYLMGYPSSASPFIIPQENPQNNQTTGTTGIYANDTSATKDDGSLLIIELYSSTYLKD
jgi:hypothetical protein